MSKDTIQSLAIFILRYIVAYAVLYISFADTISALALFTCTMWLVMFIHMIYELEDMLERNLIERRVRKATLKLSKEELERILEHDE